MRWTSIGSSRDFIHQYHPHNQLGHSEYQLGHFEHKNESLYTSNASSRAAHINEVNFWTIKIIHPSIERLMPLPFQVRPYQLGPWTFWSIFLSLLLYTYICYYFKIVPPCLSLTTVCLTLSQTFPFSSDVQGKSRQEIKAPRRLKLESDAHVWSSKQEMEGLGRDWDPKLVKLVFVRIWCEVVVNGDPLHVETFT